MTPRPLTIDDVPRLHLRFDSIFSRTSLLEHARDYPELAWTNDHYEYITGMRWKTRDDIGEILELSGPGRGVRGLLAGPVADPQWPARRAALIEALITGFRQRQARLVLLGEREADRHLPVYQPLGFELVEDIIYYRKPDIVAPPPGNRLRLVPLHFDDIPKLMELEQRVFPWLWWYGEDEWFMISMMSGVETSLAYSGGDLAGYETHTVRNGHGHLDRIGVDPALQGRGLGEELLLHATRRIAELGGRDVGLSTQRANGRARRLYEKHGFRVTGRGLRFYGRLLDGTARAALTQTVADPES